MRSERHDEIYVGFTNDLKRRFEQHNNGESTHTKKYMPWKIVYYEAYPSAKLARTRETRLKYNGNAIRELKKRIGLL